MTPGILWLLGSAPVFALDAGTVATQVEEAAAATDQVVVVLLVDASSAFARRVRQMTQADNVVFTPISPLGDRRREIDLALTRTKAGCGFVLDPSPVAPSLERVGSCTPSSTPDEAAAADSADAAHPSGPDELPHVFAAPVSVTILLGDDGGVSVGQQVLFRVSDRVAAGGGIRFLGMTGATDLQVGLTGEFTPLGDVARGLFVGAGLGYLKQSVTGLFGYDFDLVVADGRLGGRYTVPGAPPFLSAALGYSAIFSADLVEPVHGANLTLAAGLAF